MANEQTYTGMGGNLRAAEIFNRLIHEDLTDRTDLRSTSVLLGDLGGSGSDTLVTPRVAFDDAMAAANVDEVTEADNTALGNGAISLSIAQQILAREVSDKLAITGAPGNLDLQILAADIVRAYVLRFTDLVCATFTTFTAIVSSTGVNMDMDDFYAAMDTLEQAVVPGPWSMVLFTVQWTDLRTALRGEGLNPYLPAGSEHALGMHDPGYKGLINGVQVFASDSVGSDGPDSNAAMYGPGGLVHAIASPNQAMAGSISAPVPAGSPLYAEFVRDGDPGLSQVVGHAFLAVGIGENARGVEIKTDR